MKIVTYTRVSTKSQGESGLGLEAQERDIQLYIEAYTTDAEIIGSFCDVASGKNSNRYEYNMAVKLAQEHGAILLVAKLDRISRDVETIAGLIKKVGLKVACLPFADNFQLHLYAALAEQEREFISLRTKAALKAKRERGESMNNPLNFNRPEVLAKSHTTIKNNAEQWKTSILPLILPIVASTRTYKEACNILNTQGIKTARNGKFHPTTLSRLLNAS